MFKPATRGVTHAARLQAMAEGWKTFITGVPCHNGNVAPRRLSNSYCTCAPCLDADRERARNYRAKNPEAARESHRKYMRNNKAKSAATTMKRKARKIRATPPWLAKDDLAKIESIYVKAQEVTLATNIPHEVDHIVPLQGKAVSGLHVPWNLAVIPKSENRRKGARYV